MTAYTGVATDDLQVGLANSSDSSKGSALIGFKRAALTDSIGTVAKMLSAQPANLLEFSSLITVRPDPNDSSTWDWKPALLAAAAANPIVDGLGHTYRISATSIPGKVNLTNIKLKPAASVTGFTLLTIAGNDSYIEVEVDAETKGITCVDVVGDRVKGWVDGFNVTGQDQSTGGTQSALRIQGSDCKLGVYAENFLQGTSANPSIPRLVTTDLSVAGATRNNILYAVGNNVQSGWVTAQEKVHCASLILDTVSDNCIYHLQGLATAGTVRIKNCDDEPIASSGTLHIDDLTVIDSHGFASISNCDLTIGVYTVISSDPTKHYQVLAARPTNISSKVKIGVLQGEINLVTDITLGGIFQFIAGEILNLDIGSMNLKLNYVTGSTKILASMAVLKSLNIGQMSLELNDTTATLTIADKFDFRIPVALSASSYLGPIKSISATGDIRITEVSQPLLRLAPFADVSTTFGPYILQEQTVAPKPRIFWGSLVPTVGAWLRGDILKVRAPFIGGVTEYICTTAGTPGTWRASGWIPKRDITANRPPLTANDVGVQYLDNTLDPDGKPIWWNGAAWVDATGAVV